MVRKCTVTDLEQSANWHDLIEEYADESAITGMPRPNPNMDLYKAMEFTAGLSVFGAFRGSTLLGFATILTSVLPHYNIKVCVTESLFVGKDYRNSGLGLYLIQAAEQYAKENGAVGLLISAPANGKLADLLPKIGYRNSNMVFFRSIASE